MTPRASAGMNCSTAATPPNPTRTRGKEANVRAPSATGVQLAPPARRGHRQNRTRPATRSQGTHPNRPSPVDRVRPHRDAVRLPNLHAALPALPRPSPRLDMRAVPHPHNHLRRSRHAHTPTHVRLHHYRLPRTYPVRIATVHRASTVAGRHSHRSRQWSPVDSRHHAQPGRRPRAREQDRRRTRQGQQWTSLTTRPA